MHYRPPLEQSQRFCRHFENEVHLLVDWLVYELKRSVFLNKIHKLHPTFNNIPSSGKKCILLYYVKSNSPSLVFRISFRKIEGQITSKSVQEFLSCFNIFKDFIRFYYRFHEIYCIFDIFLGLLTFFAIKIWFLKIFGVSQYIQRFLEISEIYRDFWEFGRFLRTSRLSVRDFFECLAPRGDCNTNQYRGIILTWRRWSILLTGYIQHFYDFAIRGLLSSELSRSLQKRKHLI